ncbi:hypothetical protein H5410_027325 [Solanum commersonii]|uniref:Uncharacterized protein n=1 Tax=Solanum commersonii TaxID=4109 RepID=A0A9J5YYX1_SOLCO|nr:hypothetical protein H5410_027325 [Solanum commersonii]
MGDTLSQTPAVRQEKLTIQQISLSKRSHKTDVIHHYYTTQQLPPIVKRSYLLEKIGISHFRRKKLKRIKQPP